MAIVIQTTMENRSSRGYFQFRAEVDAGISLEGVAVVYTGANRWDSQCVIRFISTSEQGLVPCRPAETIHCMDLVSSP